MAALFKEKGGRRVGWHIFVLFFEEVFSLFPFVSLFLFLSQADMSKPAEVEALFKETAAAFKDPVSILVNNAGITKDGTFHS